MDFISSPVVFISGSIHVCGGPEGDGDGGLPESVFASGRFSWTGISSDVPAGWMGQPQVAKEESPPPIPWT